MVAAKMPAEKKSSKEEKDCFKTSDNTTLKNWINFYSKTDTNFKAENFVLESETEFEPKPRETDFFDKKADQSFSDFYIYSPDRKNLIDIDSSHWALYEGEIGFEIDQEIFLINIPKKKSDLISFHGSSGW